jgi:hypothetical protein
MRKPFIFKLVLLVFVGSFVSYSQDVAYSKAYDLADSLVKLTFGPTFASGGVLDVDHILAMSKDSSQWEGYIFEDPTRQLQHCILFFFGKWDSMDAKERYGSGISLNDSAGVGIIRAGKIAWHSNRFIRAYSEVGSRISGFADLNNDGITDIICSISENYTETLWLVSPNQLGGKLLNALDQNGYSTIEGGDDTFKIFESGKGGLKTIKAIRPLSEDLKEVLYTLQGSIFRELKSKRQSGR